MNTLLTDAIMKKLGTTLESIGGAQALYGDPITVNGEQIVPVARITVSLTAGAEGSGGGQAGLPGIGQLTKGGGGGNTEAAVRIVIEPVGYLQTTPNGLVFCPLDPGR